MEVHAIHGCGRLRWYYDLLGLGTKYASRRGQGVFKGMLDFMINANMISKYAYFCHRTLLTLKPRACEARVVGDLLPASRN